MGGIVELVRGVKEIAGLVSRSNLPPEAVELPAVLNINGPTDIEASSFSSEFMNNMNMDVFQQQLPVLVEVVVVGR